jgi:hypothetical protein
MPETTSKFISKINRGNLHNFYFIDQGVNMDDIVEEIETDEIDAKLTNKENPVDSPSLHPDLSCSPLSSFTCKLITINLRQ